MTEMTRDEIAAAMGELQRRRYAPRKIEGKGGYPAKAVDYLKAQAETTTQEDVDMLNQAYRMLDEFSKSVLMMRESVWSEFTRGLRCGVCGQTAAQSAAIGYDCAREC